MNRSVDRWKLCNPKMMCTEQSEVAQIFAMEDARHDIIELDDQNKRMRSILKMIAYPKRGTTEESMSLQDFADLIQSAYTMEQLEP